MRYRLPEGCVGVSIAGATLAPDEDGIVMADAAAADELAAHGIVPVEAPASTRSSAPTPPKGRART